jgi:hypothetical protein
MAENIRAKLVNVSCERALLWQVVDGRGRRSASKTKLLRGTHCVTKTLRNFTVLFSLATPSP